MLNWFVRPHIKYADEILIDKSQYLIPQPMASLMVTTDLRFRKMSQRYDMICSLSKFGRSQSNSKAHNEIQQAHYCWSDKGLRGIRAFSDILAPKYAIDLI
jgi:hypothetical protein